MLSFESDYIQGAHPEILKRMTETNLDPHPGYGTDDICASARKKIREACGCPEADVSFLVGGTQANSTVISALLAGYEGVISAETGHIGTHEAGAVEATGHKVLCLPEHDGKISADELAAYLDGFYADGTHEHMVIPGMVYVSHPTEYGSLYSLAELEAVASVCRARGLSLFLDGARLGYGLMSRETDVTLPDIARLCDAFYIGGTKVGALFGEAVVFPKGQPKHFMTTTKQHGALLAKGWLLGLQFDTLFTDGLYFRIAAHAIDMAEKMKKIFSDCGIPFYRHSPTNQQFVVLSMEMARKLAASVAFTPWGPHGSDAVIARFVTSWATTDEDLDRLSELLSR